jgi:hypothetical protein
LIGRQPESPCCIARQAAVVATARLLAPPAARVSLHGDAAMPTGAD